MGLRRISAVAAVSLAVLAWARPARASAELGLGGDYLFDPHQGEFQLTLGVDGRLARHVTVGARVGAALLTDPGRLGIPIDARIRFHAQRVYFEAMAGPWIVFDEASNVRFHGAVGFGILQRSVSIGLEVGYLNPTAMVGIRLIFPI